MIVISSIDINRYLYIIVYTPVCDFDCIMHVPPVNVNTAGWHSSQSNRTNQIF